MSSIEEYEDALIYISDPFVVIRKVLEDRLKEKCIYSKDIEEMKACQAQFQLLSQLDTEITNIKEGNK